MSDEQLWGDGSLPPELVATIKKKIDELLPVDPELSGKYLNYKDAITFVRSAFFDGAQYALNELASSHHP